VDDQPVDPHEPTMQLARDALEQARELLRLEMALARDELKSELSRTKACVIALVLAVGAAVASGTLFLVAIAWAFSGVRLAVLFACALLLTAIALGLAGSKRLPTKPMAETTERIASGVKQVKERIQ
jgi:putative superfamily III holin-X